MPEQYIYSQGPELTILIPHYKTLELKALFAVLKEIE